MERGFGASTIKNDTLSFMTPTPEHLRKAELPRSLSRIGGAWKFSVHPWPVGFRQDCPDPCIGDVAQVHDGYQSQQNVVRLDSVRAVLLTILKSGLASASWTA